MTTWADHQLGIYAAGMFGGEVPDITTDLANLETVAAEVLDPEALGYVVPSAGSGATAAANRAAFQRWQIVPRMLSSSVQRDQSTTVLGTSMAAPLLFAPVGVQTLAHPDGELASARAAAALGLTYVHSTQASHSIEEVAEANGGGSRWYQLYWPNEPDLCRSFLSRAAAAGYTTLVVTLDTPTIGWRPRDLDRGFLPFLANVGIANYLTDPVFLDSLERPVEEEPQAAGLRFAQVFGNLGLSWSDLPFVREHWDGPIVLKGIQAPEDAARAVAAGMDGIVVSNHGGRQVDGAIASLDALVPVVEEVAGRISVLFDSGIRTGADMVKALALGADAVLLGRPFLYGLALGGQAGVEQVVRSLLAEFDLTTALSGHHSHRELGPGSLRHLA